MTARPPCCPDPCPNRCTAVCHTDQCETYKGIKDWHAEKREVQARERSADAATCESGIRAHKQAVHGGGFLSRAVKTMRGDRLHGKRVY